MSSPVIRVNILHMSTENFACNHKIYPYISIACCIDSCVYIYKYRISARSMYIGIVYIVVEVMIFADENASIVYDAATCNLLHTNAMVTLCK